MWSGLFEVHFYHPEHIPLVSGSLVIQMLHSAPYSIEIKREKTFVVSNLFSLECTFSLHLRAIKSKNALRV